MTVQLRTVQLPEELCANTEAWLAGRFESLESFLGFLLHEIVNAESSQLDRQEEEVIQQRLRDLGYI